MKPISDRILISVPTTLNTREPDFGREMMAFFDRFPKLAPEWVFHIERDRRSVESAEDCLKYWANIMTIAGPNATIQHVLDFKWGRKKNLKADGGVHHTGASPRGIEPGRCHIESEIDFDLPWRHVFTSLCELFDPPVATIHLLTKEQRVPAPFGSPEAHFRLGVTGYALQGGQIPNLAWGTYFGGEFAKYVDARMLRRNYIEVCKLGNGFVLYATPEIGDVKRDFAEFAKRRLWIKSLFEPGLFQISG